MFIVHFHISRVCGHLLAHAGLLVVLLNPCAAEVRLVDGGQSDYVIYRDPGARHDLGPTAAELSRLIAASTGVTLKVVTEPAEPMICLGDNASSRAAGIDAGKLPVEGYRI